MRLSEAIRLGAMLHPQGFGFLRRNASNDDNAARTCALGAALTAVDAMMSAKVADALWPILTRRVTPCPGSDCTWVPTPTTVGIVLTHLNDYHCWTREQIADWVETIEPSDTPMPAPEKVTTA